MFLLKWNGWIGTQRMEAQRCKSKTKKPRRTFKRPRANESQYWGSGSRRERIAWLCDLMREMRVSRVQG